MWKKLECKFKSQNKYSSHVILVLSKEMQKSNQKCEKTDCEFTVGHIRNVLAKYCFQWWQVGIFTPSEQLLLKITDLHQKKMPGVSGGVFEMLCVGVLVCCIGVLWLVEVLKWHYGLKLRKKIRSLWNSKRWMWTILSC